MLYACFSAIFPHASLLFFRPFFKYIFLKCKISENCLDSNSVMSKVLCKYIAVDFYFVFFCVFLYFFSIKQMIWLHSIYLVQDIVASSFWKKNRVELRRRGRVSSSCNLTIFIGCQHAYTHTRMHTYAGQYRMWQIRHLLVGGRFTIHIEFN